MTVLRGHPNYEIAVKLSKHVKTSLTEFGFLLASEKCNCLPVLKLTWLGYLLNMSCGKVHVTERIARLEVAIESFLYQMKVSGTGLMKVRFPASRVGQIISLQTVVGKLVSLRTRAITNIKSGLERPSVCYTGGHRRAGLLAVEC